ncbi:hypothetical protein Syun_012110 [Stephania yunnanensis]|uniref:Uncharacterized protein n=1 Tax=Stephania yunnanensis TaxID=152371 RepID=A0AAP0K147_9MAGN
MDGRPVLHGDNVARRVVQYGGPLIQLPTESRVLEHNSRKYTSIEIQLRSRDEFLMLMHGGTKHEEIHTCVPYDGRRWKRATSGPLFYSRTPTRD